MVMPAISPAISTPANTMRTANPMAMPITSCCTTISRPGSDAGSAAGNGGTPGAITSDSMMPSPIFTRAGTLTLPNSGATEISPMMRTNGHSSAAIHVLSWALVMSIIARAGRGLAASRPCRGNR